MTDHMVKQQTIEKEVSLTGVGLHTGKDVTITFKPAPDNHGFSFVRIDLEGNPEIEADVNYVVNTQRGTNLEKLGVQINTSEHVLAALVGLQIDNCIIELNASEPPIMDGSSKYFVEILEQAGIVEQESPREEYIVKEIISYTDENTGSEIIVMPAKEYQVTTMVDFGTNVLGTQNASINDISEFKDEISNARTFKVRRLVPTSERRPSPGPAASRPRARGPRPSGCALAAPAAAAGRADPRWRRTRCDRRPAPGRAAGS